MAARVEAIFLESADLDPDSRRRFLDSACGGDTELRAQIDTMLQP